jgi:glycosyltransferase involved in cell wall biosynthesis
MNVYVPTWNSSATLEQCINGIFRAVPNAEICVVDHASVDDTKMIAKRHGTYEVFMGNLGETRTHICEVASKSDEPFMMVDSDVELPNNFIDVAKNFLVLKNGAVYGRKQTVGEKPQKYEAFVYSAYSFPVVNSKRLDTSCTLFNPEAIKGFVCHWPSYEDYALGKHMRSRGFSYVLLDLPCKHLGLGDFRVYLSHVRWAGAGLGLIGLPSTWKLFASVFWMPLKSPCKLLTFQVRLHYVVGFLFYKHFLEYNRGGALKVNCCD